MGILTELSQNKILGAAILSWAVAQLIKVIISLVATKKMDISIIVSSGGMPSSHSSFMTALTTCIGFSQGFNTPIFALSTAVTFVIMYDAAGVRRAAGKQAEVLNMLVESLEHSGIKLDKKLKELLGHSPIQVLAGAILGIIIGALMSYV